MASYLHVPIMVCGGLANGDFSHLRDGENTQHSLQ